MNGSIPQNGIDAGLQDLQFIAEAFASLGALLASAVAADPFEAITTAARDQLLGAAGASITTFQQDRFVTVAATDDRTRQADAIQYELGSGPCIDAILQATMYRPRDLRTDDRWPSYGRRVADELGLDSMLSYRMQLPSQDTVAGLNVYAEGADGFTESDAVVGMLLATHGAQAASLVLYDRRVQSLEKALASNRRIGIAIGVLMSSHKLTDEQAFDLLRVAGQNTNRSLTEIAHDVIETGTLDVTPPRWPTG
ncbi:ANTAR domain-containing protein [Terrabacter sp. GCM10028922]|uniref:ANTAR domain-containing protein n=1 Tax=Terrabacter sp. GCM10028922 TaxID=3273428 RepID=UPI0036230A0B